MAVTVNVVAILFAISVFVSASIGNVIAQSESLSNNVNEESNEEQTSHSSSSQTSLQADNPLRSMLTRGSHRLTNNKNMASVMEAINSGNWDRFTPAPVTEPNCYVEVQVVERVPGRCIRVGNGRPACQTQHYLSLNTEECS